MDLVVPDVNVAPRASRGKVGHFVHDVGYDGSQHYLSAYRDGMAELQDFAAYFDLRTSFGTVRAYRFDGSAAPGGPPVVLLPGRNAATPMWRANLPTLLARRTVYGLDLLGEAGLSVQEEPITGADDQARWLDEALTQLELQRAHLLGASVGGWAAANYAVRHPMRVASLVLLDPVMTFDKIPLRTLLASGALLSPTVPEAVRRRVLSWISGGAPVDDSEPEARLIAAAMVDFVLRLPPPKRITDDHLRALKLPVLTVLGGRSVMLDAPKAAAVARALVPHGQVELWSEASHALNGEFPDRIAEYAHRLWDAADSQQ